MDEETDAPEMALEDSAEEEKQSILIPMGGLNSP